MITTRNNDRQLTTNVIEAEPKKQTPLMDHEITQRWENDKRRLRGIFQNYENFNFKMWKTRKVSVGKLESN